MKEKYRVFLSVYYRVTLLYTSHKTRRFNLLSFWPNTTHRTLSMLLLYLGKIEVTFVVSADPFVLCGQQVT